MTKVTNAAKSSIKHIGIGTAITCAAALGTHTDPYPAIYMGVGAMIGIVFFLVCISTNSES